MKKFLLASLMLGASAFVSSAAPLCSSFGSLTVLGLTNFTCETQLATYSFGATPWLSTAIGGATPADITQLMVSFTDTGERTGITVTSTLPSKFDVTGFQQIYYTFEYDVTAKPTVQFVAVTDVLAGALTTGSIQITKILSDSGGGIIAGLQVNNNPASSSAVASIPPPGNSFKVTDTIGLQASGSEASFVSFTNELLTPEPVSFSLMGIGLVSLGLIRKRFKN